MMHFVLYITTVVRPPVAKARSNRLESPLVTGPVKLSTGSNIIPHLFTANYFVYAVPTGVAHSGRAF
jgi:hypothetical protein